MKVEFKWLNKESREAFIEAITNKRLLRFLGIICLLLLITLMIFFLGGGTIINTAEGTIISADERVIDKSIEKLNKTPNLLQIDEENLKEDLKKLSRKELKEQVDYLLLQNEVLKEKAQQLIQELKSVKNERDKEIVRIKIIQFLDEFDEYQKLNVQALSKKLVSQQLEENIKTWENEYLAEIEKNKSLLREKDRYKNLYEQGKVSITELQDRILELETALAESTARIEELSNQLLASQGDNSTLKGRIGKLEGEIETLSTIIDETAPIRISEIKFTVPEASINKEGKTKARRRLNNILLSFLANENYSNSKSKFNVKIVVTPPEGYGAKKVILTDQELIKGKKFTRNLSKVNDFSLSEKDRFPSGLYTVYVYIKNSTNNEYGTTPVAKGKIEVK